MEYVHDPGPTAASVHDKAVTVPAHAAPIVCGAKAPSYLVTRYPSSAAPPGIVIAVQLTVTLRPETETDGVGPPGMDCARVEA